MFHFYPENSAQRIETAEPPEPLTFQHSEFIITKQILLKIAGPAARHFSR
jgi:hypothetical protein